MRTASPIAGGGDAVDFSRLADTIGGVDSAIPSRGELKTILRKAESATARGYFTPDEDEIVRGAFSQFLAARAALSETLRESCLALAGESWPRKERSPEMTQAFVLGFAAAALIMRTSTWLIDRAAGNRIVRRKLDEAEPRFGIPRKQFTRVYRNTTLPERVWTFHWVMRKFDEMRPGLELSGAPSWYGEILDLADRERALLAERFRRRTYAERRLRYRWFSWKRRNRSGWEQVLFSMMELGGTTISRVHNPFHRKRVTPATVERLARLLRPGDVLVSRHDDAMTNLFLPGYWPHASLYIGDRSQRDEWGVDSEKVPDRDAHGHLIRTLESKKDGVRFRSLEETLSVDAFVVIRPVIPGNDLRPALERSMSHEGKLYDFNFDFTRGDRLVCTEVVYRGFHGVPGLDFPLTERAGRLTFAAEDLLDMAVEDRGFEVVAIAGVTTDDLLTGEEAFRELRESYGRSPEGITASSA